MSKKVNALMPHSVLKTAGVWHSKLIFVYLNVTDHLTQGRLLERNFKMDEQQNVPNSPNQVTHKVNIKEAYNVKAATVVGVIHIICGIIALGADIWGMNTALSSRYYVAGLGIGASVFFFVSGGLAIGGARSGNKCLLVATMVMCIISVLAAGSLLFMSLLFLLVTCMDAGQGCQSTLDPYWCFVGVGAVMLVLAVASASLTCRPLCCPSTKKATTYYNTNQA